MVFATSKDSARPGPPASSAPAGLPGNLLPIEPDVYEFNGWAVIESNEGTDDADDELMGRLMEHLDGLPEQSRKHYHTADFVLNGFRSIFVSGLRNHPQPDVMGMLDWLAGQSRRAYGLLYIRDDSWGEPDRFDVWRLQGGKLTHHDDPFFTRPSVTAAG